MSREGCVCCPYPLLTIPGLLSFIALVFVWVAAMNCNFFGITFLTSEGRDVLLSVGLWTVESNFVAYDGSFSYGSYCAGWKNANFLSFYDLDASLKAARAFGMISAVMATLSFVLILVPMCVSFGDQSYLLILCGMCVFTGLATILDLVALSSDICKSASSCTLQGAGILAIVGGILWLIIACLMFYAMKNPRSFRGDEDPTYIGSTATPVQATATPVEQPSEQKEVQTIQNADGSATKTSTVTVTNADGSKTVTQTTETIPAMYP